MKALKGAKLFYSLACRGFGMQMDGYIAIGALFIGSLTRRFQPVRVSRN
jgi:hypothetical protein